MLPHALPEALLVLSGLAEKLLHLEMTIKFHQSFAEVQLLVTFLDIRTELRSLSLTFSTRFFQVLSTELLRPIVKAYLAQHI